jgi:glycosyltransferase involved in cell wall biosynthesis
MYPSESHPSYGTFVKNFEDSLIENGFIIDKVVIKGRGTNLFKKILKYLLFFKVLKEKIKKEKYDLVYVHYISNSLLPFLIIKKPQKLKLVINAHGSDVFPKEIIGNIVLFLTKRIIRDADLVVVPSNYFKSIVEKKLQVTRDKIFVSPSGGINTDIFNNEMRKNDNYPSSLFYIGYVSRIDEGKGWDVLLRAVKKLINSGHENVKVLFVGKGKGEYELKKMIKDLDLAEVVDFIGEVKQEFLADYYAKMDLFVFPTLLNESLGLVGLEAMACGVPVIGSDIGGLRDYIINNYNGFKFSPGDDNMLCQKIQDFISIENNKKEEFRKNAIKTATKYEYKEVAKDLSIRLREVVSDKKKVDV